MLECVSYWDGEDIDVFDSVVSVGLVSSLELGPNSFSNDAADARTY